jgi:hypothetical protein
MAKKIKDSDIFQGDVFATTKEGAEQLNEELKTLISGFSKLGKSIKDDLPKGEIKTFKQIKEASESVTKLDAAYQGFTKTEQERLKVEKALLQIEQQQAKVEQQNIKNIAEEEKVKQQNIKTNILLTKEKERQAKIAAKEEKAAKALNSEYKKQSKRLNELRGDYKDLVLTQGKSADGAKELLDEIRELDEALKDVDAEVGQFQRNVGNYPKVTENAKRGIGSLSGFLLGVFTSSLQKSRDEARTYGETLEKVGNSVATISIAVIQFATKIALPAIGLFINKTQNLFITLQTKIKETQKELLEFIPESFRTDKITEKIASLNGEIDALNTTQSENNENIEKYSKLIDEAQNPFDGLIDRVNESNSTLGEQLELQDRLIDTTAKLSLEINNLTTQEELLQSIADDSTKSFAEREQAIRDVIDTQAERGALELQLAEREFEVARLGIKNDFIRRGQLEKFQALEEQGAIKSLKFLEDKELADIIGLENLEKLTTATNNLASAEGLIEVATADANKTIAELKQDRLEKDLDILIDGFDNQKTINERIIANEKKTFDERGKLLTETAKLGDETFAKQVETIQQFTDAQIDSNDLLNESDAVALNNKIRALGLSEIIEGRLLEIIRERRIVVEDLNEAETDLNDARLESTQAIAESEQAIEQDTLELKTELLERELENEELIAKEKKRITKEIYDNEKEALEDQAKFDKEQAILTINDSEELAAKLKEIESKKNNDIIRLEKEAQDEITDITIAAQNERFEKGLENAEKLIDLTSDAFEEGVEKEEKEQDEAIKRREESVALQQSRAEQGLENTLAFEKEQLAKAELERARTAEKRAKQEEALALAQAFLNAFAARSKDDPDTAAAKALTDVILAKALSETIVGAFAEGVEDFKGEGTGTSDSNLIRFSHGESVVTAKGTKENQGLVTAMNNGDVGSWFANNMMLSPLSSEKNYDSFGILAKEIKEIKYAIKNRPTSQTNLDNMGNVMQSTYRNGIKNTVKYINQPGII